MQVREINLQWYTYKFSIFLRFKMPVISVKIFYFYILNYAEIEELHTAYETFNMKINPVKHD
jgi:hypothetical protein